MRTIYLALSLFVVACSASRCSCRGDQEPTPDEGPMPELRTGRVDPVQREPVAGHWSASARAPAPDRGTYVTLTLPVELDGSAFRVAIDGHPHALAAVDRRAGQGTIVVRFAEPPSGTEELRGHVYVRSREDGTLRWSDTAFSSRRGPPSTTDVEAAREAWAAAMGHRFGEDGVGNPWYRFAAARLGTWASSDEHRVAAVENRRRVSRTELAELMATTTGALSIQEALQQDRGLRRLAKDEPRTVPVADVEPPPLSQHPFDRMRTELASADPAAPEPLANATPAEFWYVRFDRASTLLAAVAEIDTWVAPLWHALEDHPQRASVIDRYTAQLGLRRGFRLALRLDPVVGQVAVVGSDPYLREGSDVTLVLAATDPRTAVERLDAMLGDLGARQSASSSVAGHRIDVHRDPAGAVRQHRSVVGDLIVLSNSAGAIRRVLEAIDGQRPRLSDDPGFRYFRARDPAAHDGFAFLSDGFIAAVAGPRQKIQESRRQRALAELLTPGFTAMLHGWLHGGAPASVAELTASRLLAHDELQHSDGTPIAFSVETGASSMWGTPAALTPLIDLPTVEVVSKSEKAAYRNFARGYQDNWSTYMDPVAVALDVEHTADGIKATVQARAMPLIEGTDYDDLRRVVGDARVEVPPVPQGARMVSAVGADARLRSRLDKMATSTLRHKDIGLGWLGGWVEVGFLDRRALAAAVAAIDDRAQQPGPVQRGLAQLEPLTTVPAYVSASVDSRPMLVATLAGVRQLVEGAAPGMVRWEEDTAHRGTPVVKVSVDRRTDVGGTASLFYAMPGDAIVVALQRETLEVVSDRVLDHRSAEAQTPSANSAVPVGSQFVVEAQPRPGKGLWTALVWLLQGHANRGHERSLAMAEALLRGDPTLSGDPEALHRRALAYFGRAPSSASGPGAFTLGPAGAVEATHGSVVAPVFPALPVAGSPVASALSRVARFRADVSFDPEPVVKGRSLAARVELTLR